MLGNKGKKKEKKALREEENKLVDKETRDNDRKALEEYLKKTMINKDMPFTISEAYKAARTNIMFSLKDSKQSKSIIVTSANPGEGKSTTCVNFAISFAQMGAKVILLDMDMRKPRVHKYFGIRNRKGVSNILGGFSTIDSCVVHDDETGIDIITAGHIPPNPAELIASSETDIMLEKLTKEYDYVFIDTPPANVVTDTLLLSKKVTGVVMVARYKITNKDAFDRCVKTFEHAGVKMIGVVLNSVERNAYEGRYTYKSYGRYGYKRYGYGKYGYSKYGYSKYGYTKYGYNKYSYSYGDELPEELTAEATKK